MFGLTIIIGSEALVKSKNAESSKQRILDAALNEFSAFGIAGARVDRIAQAALCNKNLIYMYFENKENLFNVILHKHLERVYQEVKFTPEDLPNYATSIFDFAMANPDLMRLMAWSALEQKPIASDRNIAFDSKVAAVNTLQSNNLMNKNLSAPYLLTVINAISTTWTAASPFGLSLYPDAANDLTSLRQTIHETVKLLTGPQSKA